MKRIVALLIGVVFTQLNINAQNREARLYLKNGDTIQGFAKILSSEKVKFKHNLKGKKVIYDSNSLIKLELENNERKSFTTYSYKQYPQGIKAVFMEPIVLGRMCLYLQKISVSGGSIFTNNQSAGTLGMDAKILYKYYVCRDDSFMVFEITNHGSVFNGNFVKKAKEHFNDCPTLIEKIESKEFKRGDIGDVVRYYNETCGLIE
ncbi:hypothetical protein [Sediminicola luteus]|uniref:Uncharacterized protein n=1 Tax=Sediminicola luteus TaxID=319238 RepID=A0A2A4GCZ3_9FLAO|nr:hypothetical protein [Sediminicola luteus]PCE65836.1 hypothetical protein B7P33_00590 [Sediminicola luteus]